MGSWSTGPFKSPGVLCHHSRNSCRYAGCMRSSRRRWSRLLVGHWGHFVSCLLTHLRKTAMECRLALCTPTVVGDLVGVLSRIDNGPGVLGSYWVVGLPCLLTVTMKSIYGLIVIQLQFCPPTYAAFFKNMWIEKIMTHRSK